MEQQTGRMCVISLTSIATYFEAHTKYKCMGGYSDSLNRMVNIIFLQENLTRGLYLDVSQIISSIEEIV